MTGIGHPATTGTLPPAPRPLRLPRLRRRTIVALAVVGVVGLVAFNVGRQAWVGWSIEQEAAQLQADVTAAEAQNDALQRWLAYLQSDAYVSAEARRLGIVGYPGEQVLIIPDGSASTTPGSASQPTVADRPMLQRWLDLFIGPPTD